MDPIVSHIVIAIITFAITNVDDLLLLSFYFAHPQFKKSNIVIGQYAGVYSLVIISVCVALIGKLFEPSWIGLLGIVPIILGLKNLISLFQQKDEEQLNDSALTKGGIQILNISVVTIANGGDNIGVYTPIFANLSGNMVTLYLIVFTIMILVWCLVAFYLVKHPVVKVFFEKYGEKILPLFLIGIGVWIIIKSGVLDKLF